jgi:hypothetical protein
MYDDDEMKDEEVGAPLDMGDEDTEDEDLDEDDIPEGMHEVEEDGLY